MESARSEARAEFPTDSALTSTGRSEAEQGETAMHDIWNPWHGCSRCGKYS